jgi:hypothetical protein
MMVLILLYECYFLNFHVVIVVFVYMSFNQKIKMTLSERNTVESHTYLRWIHLCAFEIERKPKMNASATKMIKK